MQKSTSLKYEPSPLPSKEATLAMTGPKPRKQVLKSCFCGLEAALAIPLRNRKCTLIPHLVGKILAMGSEHCSGMRACSVLEASHTTLPCPALTQAAAAVADAGRGKGRGPCLVFAAVREGQSRVQVPFFSFLITLEPRIE